MYMCTCIYGRGFVDTKMCSSNAPFDRFRPKPSLSTTSSAHCIRLLLCGEAAVARRRRTGVEVRVWVAVVVVVGVEWAWEEGFW